MIGEPSLKKYAGKSPEWYYKNALAALAGTDPSFGVIFERAFGISSGHFYVKRISAVFVRRCGHFALPIYTFDPEESAALRAQEIYWRTVRNIGYTRRRRNANER